MDPRKRIGVVLSGCGVFDGSEIHEATLTLLELDRAGAEIICMAPNVDQMHVIDHLAGAPAQGSSRNVLTESSRIARGEIKDIADVNADQLDALIFPGGFGAAKNLSDFAVAGSTCSVHPDVQSLIMDMYKAEKPMGFICIAPAIAARVLGEVHPVLTIGNDEDTAHAIESMGARHVTRAVDEIATDTKLKIVSTPAYMLGPSIAPVSVGIAKLVDRVLSMA
jgi:enhancing lycopene biosynthesis protein 2